MGAVAAAWGGVVDVSSSVCGSLRRLTKIQPVLTKLACDVHLGSASPTASLAVISGDDLARRLVSRTLAELGTASSALKGELHLTSTSVVMQEGGCGCLWCRQHAHRSWHQAAQKSRGGGTICRLGFKCVWRLRRVAAS